MDLANFDDSDFFEVWAARDINLGDNVIETQGGHVCLIADAMVSEQSGDVVATGSLSIVYPDGDGDVNMNAGSGVTANGGDIYVEGNNVSIY